MSSLEAGAFDAAREALEGLVARYNRRRFVHPDPIEFLYAYPDLRDREIVGLIASSLAYGRVLQILRSISRVLDAMGPSPFAFLLDASPAKLRRTFAGFKHRFTTGEELVHLLGGVKRCVRAHGSLNACFTASFSEADETVLPALLPFARELTCDRPTSLIARPDSGSACKRLNLFLRWMVRRDQVDPGGWIAIPASALIVPLDTHLFRYARELGLTKRDQADMRTALEITGAFRAFAPGDPVRYDFALTRLGIRRDGLAEPFLAAFRRAGRIPRRRSNGV